MFFVGAAVGAPAAAAGVGAGHSVQTSQPVPQEHFSLHVSVSVPHHVGHVIFTVGAGVGVLPSSTKNF